MRRLGVASCLAGPPVATLAFLALFQWADFWPAMVGIVVSLLTAALFAMVWGRDLELLTDALRRVASDDAVPVAETSVLRVPASAVIRRGQMELVFIRNDKHAQLRIVKTGKPISGEIEIVSGVNAGEQVIIEGSANLADGQPIEVRP